MLQTKLFLSAVFLVSATSITVIGEPQIWTISSRADILKGDARSVSVDPSGTISLAPRLTEVFKTEQPYVWSSAIDASGNVYLGTGGEGRIYKVVPGGTGVLFTDLNELNVSAIAIGRNGEVFASTAPDGKVYQIDPAGKATVFFDPKEKYIWSLAVMSDGSLAVGTGEKGKIYLVRSANQPPESSLLFDSSETHIISLCTDKAGNLFAGTDPGGIVLRIGVDGKPFALLDTPLREIHELGVGPDGSVYALALSGSVSTSKPAEPSPSATPESNTVTAEAATPLQPAAAQKSRYDMAGAKTAIYRITSDGGNDLIYTSPTVIGFSIYAHRSGNGVLLGTSDKGRIYSISNDGRESLALQTDAGQISTILSQGSNLYATSSNQGKLYKIGPDTIPEGAYESAVLDAKTTAAWGSIWWRAIGNVVLETRSGNTESPNETWSSWQVVRSEPQRGKVPSPNSRFLQWRAVLKTSTPAAALNEVAVAFLTRNIAPEILSIDVLPVNVGLASNPPPQIDPNILSSGMDPKDFGMPVQAVPPRKVYLRGARSIQWTSEDRNGDKLIYDVYIKESGAAEFKPLRTDLTDNFISIDGISLADGRYTVKIVAKDAASNPSGRALSGERISEPFDIDNSQPVVTVLGQPTVDGTKARVSFAASDRWGYIVRAEYSVNGGEWQTVYADDGISDGPEEKYTFDIPAILPGEYSVTLRVFDAAGNVGNARVIVKK